MGERVRRKRQSLTIVTVMPEETLGISKILSDYRAETTFQKLDDSSTKVEISHYYLATTLKAKLLNLIAKGKIASETQATYFEAAKAAIVRSSPPARTRHTPPVPPGVAFSPQGGLPLSSQRGMRLRTEQWDLPRKDFQYKQVYSGHSIDFGKN